MSERSTSDFFRLMNESNAAIAAAEAEKEVSAAEDTDQVRLQRDAERREKWGQLRAVVHPSKHPNRGVNQFFH